MEEGGTCGTKITSHFYRLLRLISGVTRNFTLPTKSKPAHLINLILFIFFNLKGIRRY